EETRHFLGCPLGKTDPDEQRTGSDNGTNSGRRIETGQDTRIIVTARFLSKNNTSRKHRTGTSGQTAQIRNTHKSPLEVETKSVYLNIDNTAPTHRATM